jgi:hypothetical protein
MAEHRRHEPLGDEPIDRELDGLLAVEPSPEFLARVRMRVAAESMGRQRGVAWRWVVAGAATIAIAAAIVARENQPSPASAAWPTRATRAASSLEIRATEALSPNRRDRQAVPQNASAAVAPAQRQRLRLVERPTSEVLVSPTEAAGLRDLLMALQDGRIDPKAVPRDRAAVDSDVPITITPIIVEPLSVAVDLE